MDSFDEGYAAVDGGSVATTGPPYEDDVGYGNIGEYEFNAPPPPHMADHEEYGGSPPRSLDDFSMPMDNNNINDNVNMQSSENMGFSTPPSAIPDIAPSPFEPNGDGKSYDIGADTDGLFSSAAPDDVDGPLLPDPSEMLEEGTAFREWRR